MSRVSRPPPSNASASCRATTSPSGASPTSVLPTFSCDLTAERMLEGLRRVRSASERGAGTRVLCDYLLKKNGIRFEPKMIALSGPTHAEEVAVNTFTYAKKNLRSLPEGGKRCFIVGNEGHGLPQDVIDAAGHASVIPMAFGTESLNAAVAASVILYEQGKSR